MAKIDFSKLPCWVDIRREAKILLDVKFNFANTLYMQGQGVAMGALAMKIYNAQGEEEYNAEECAIIIDFAKRINPMLADSLADIINNEEKDGTDNQ